MDTIYPIGRVYKLVSSNGLVYIGSTKKTLSQRLSKHNNDYKRFLNHKMTFVSSFKLFENPSIFLVILSLILKLIIALLICLRQRKVSLSTSFNLMTRFGRSID